MSDTGETTRSPTDPDPKEEHYTPEELEAVKKIRKCKDYYEILGVNKDCSDYDLKKNYHKQARKFHPDKNHAPGAIEAFKAVGNAFAVLRDSGKRRTYDLFEREAVRMPSKSGHTYSSHKYDEMFNDIFGRSFPQSHVHRRRAPHSTVDSEFTTLFTFFNRL